MPFAQNRGVHIHYETEGTGPALVLHHGTMGSGPDWRDLGYIDALKDRYKLILVDARGHGQSDKPHDPAAYDLSLRAADVVAVLDDLGVASASFLGYSMGGWIGFGLAKYFPQRIGAFIIGGAHPYAENTQAIRDRMPNDPAAFAAGLEKTYGDLLTPARRARLLANDLDALRSLTRDRDDISDVLPAMTMPSLVFCGELDPRLARARQAASEMPNASFLGLPGCDHVGTTRRTDIIIPRIRAFLRDATARETPALRA
jgi:pimeloyl-ACP methyl ester carboxylesterase